MALSTQRWAFGPSIDVSELPMRDPRILLGCVSALIIILGFSGGGCAGGRRRRSGARILCFRWRSCSWCPTRYGRMSGRSIVISPFRRPERSSGSGGSAGPVWSARPPWMMSSLFALVFVGALRTTSFRTGTASRPVLRPSPFNCRPSSRTRWCSFSIPSPTVSSCLQCRVPCADRRQ